MSTLARYALVPCLLMLVAGPAAAQQHSPSLVPWPRRVELKSGLLDMGRDSRIVAAEPALQPLAKILAEEIQAIIGVRLAVVDGLGGPKDISLATDAGLHGEAYTLTVADRVTIRGGNYGAVALGTATFLQALQSQDGRATLPYM